MLDQIGDTVIDALAAYFGEAHNRRIVHLRDAGDHLVWVGETRHDAPLLTSLATDQWGNVYAASPQAACVTKFNPDLMRVAELTGDLARRDRDGWFWFVGRADDVIKSAGHLIGPFEVESALLEHPAVAEAAAIGKPDPVALESVKAFVALKPGYAPTEELRLELLGFGRSRLGRAVAPKEIAFLPGLPRTRSGKIMRRLLKARELGLPEGDISTLEGGREDAT